MAKKTEKRIVIIVERLENFDDVKNVFSNFDDDDRPVYDLNRGWLSLNAFQNGLKNDFVLEVGSKIYTITSMNPNFVDGANSKQDV